MCSVVSDSFETPWTVDGQAPLSTGFSRQEHWSGLPFPTPGTEPVSPASPALAGRFFTTMLPGKLHNNYLRRALKITEFIFVFLFHQVLTSEQRGLPLRD